MKVLVVAGGTGGHFYPGLSVAKELAQSGVSVRFLLRKGDIVIPMVQEAGFPYSTIFAAGFKRRLSIANLAALTKLSVGTFGSFFLFFQDRPTVVLAMGGYLSVPAALTAKLLRIPVILHEQNVKPGAANRLIGRWASSVAVAFAESRKYFSGPVVVTGNPVRPELLLPANREEALRRFSLDSAKKTLLVFGGSLGARRLNEMLIEALGSLAELAKTWQVIHISGSGDEARVRSGYAKLSFRHHVAGYCHDMASAYAAADFIVCRAGASTVSELAVLKKPALLVPYPYASENHQWANAMVLKEKGAALVYEEAELAGGKMAAVLGLLLRDEAERRRMADACAEVGMIHRSAAGEIKKTVLSYGVVKTPISPK